MHVGLAPGFAHQRGDAYPAQFMREELENLVLAEELGFDSVWITEHHFSDYSISTDPLQLLGYIAGRCRRLKLGTQVIVVPWRDPVRLAEAIDAYAIDFGKTAVTGTPRMILDRLWELKQVYGPQGFFPHVYYGGMPQDEALKNLRLFAAKVLPEVRSWQADTSIDARFGAER